MKLLIAFLLAAALACAQSAGQLEIRGTVVEGSLGIGGVAVTLYEFGHTPAESTTRSVFATTSTDSKGEFVFHPARSGQYYVEVQKEGYFAESYNGPTVDPVDSTGDPVSIDADHPSQERKFSLMRLGELRGRVIDEDGKPMTKLRVGIRPGTSTPVITDQDGYFTATKLRPGDYLVSILRRGPEILSKFSEEDLKIVDQDLATSSSPAVPFPVSSGASLSVGTLTARKSLSYRVHLSVESSDCAPEDKWTFSAIPAGDTSGFALPLQVPCAKEFLVRNLAPGSYTFTLSTGGRPGEKRRWAIVPVEVTGKSSEIALTMSPAAEISGRLVAADGVTLGSFPSNIRIQVTPLTTPSFGSQIIVPDPNGKFLIQGLSGDRHQVSVKALPYRSLYVKEMRYNGLAVTDSIITPVAGAPAPLEFVIDDKAAIVRGSVTAGDKPAALVWIAAVKWPVSPEAIPLTILLSVNANTFADEAGRFQIDGLAPGEYRVLALPRDTMSHLSTDHLVQLLNRAEKVTLERGGSQSISLKITEP